MRVIGILLLLVLTSVPASGEIPDSIVGTWNLDMLRTMNEHLDRMAQARPDVISSEIAQAQKSAMSKQTAQISTQVVITITKDSITTTNANAEPITTPYTVIGGNSRLVVVESKDPEGYESVVNIRLVEDGIAVETTNCREQPEQCKREQQRAVKQLKDKADKNSSTRVDYDSNLDGAISSPPVDEMSQPKWVYLRKAK